MVYFRNTSGNLHLQLKINTDCTAEEDRREHEIDIAPFKTINFGSGGECGVGSLQISTSQNSPSENKTHYKSEPYQKTNDTNEKSLKLDQVWWKGMIPLEPLATIHIFPEKGEVFSDLPGSVKILIPNELNANSSIENYFAKQLIESEQGIERDTKREKEKSGTKQHIEPTQDKPPATIQTNPPSRFPSFSTIIKVLLVILGVIGLYWYIMKRNKKHSLF